MSRRRRPRAFRPLAALLGILTVAGCGEVTAPGPTERITELPRALTADEVRIIGGSNDFAFDLLREIVLAGDTPNVFISPLSASMAFGMAMNGAEGETWTQMRDVLGFEGMEEPAINEAYRDLIALLLDLDPQVRFGIGNSVWTDEGFEFLPDYMDRLRTYFDAEARALRFRSPEAVETINRWVSDATEGRIDKLLETIPPEVVAYLINAVYFKGDWRDRFDPDHTAPAPFTRDDGSTVQVEMMTGKVGRRVLFGSDGTQAVELPYGGDAFTAVAVLPPRDQAIRDFVAGLDGSVWAEWIAEFDAQASAPSPEDGGAEPEALAVFLPRLEIEWGDSLIEPLRRLGMVDAFSPRDADFSRMTGTRDLYIAQALQKTFLKVDEEGTEAAAATAVGMGRTSGPPTLRFDRPYLFAIRERLSGTILFIGVIGAPSE
jgi:serine protease inhibitor